MKQIGKYFVEDDFEYETDEAFGVTLYRASSPVKGKNLFADIDQMAYDYAIGQVCEKCGKLTDGKYYLTCNTCSEIKNNSNFALLPEVEATKFIYSDTLDEYFVDEETMWERITEYVSECTEEFEDITLEYFKLHTCCEVHASTIDISQCFDEAHEDYDIETINHEIFELEKQINDLLSKEVIAYAPVMKTKMKITDSMREELEESKKQIIDSWREEYDAPQY